jgi:hypothetical protein
MTTIDPATRAWLDQDDRRTADVIRKHGVAITCVGVGDCADCPACRAGLPRGGTRESDTGAGTPFAYTVGLFGIGHPELLVLGLDPTTSALVLNDAAGRVRAGRDLTIGQLLTFPRWRRRVIVEHVPNPGEIAFAANRFYRRPPEHSVELLQLSYTDVNGHFPGEPGYSLALSVQPRPGTFRA